VAYTIKKIAFNIIITYFYIRGNADTEVIILTDEVACLLSTNRYVGSMKISQNSPLVIKLPIKIYPCLLISLFSLCEEDKLPHYKNPSIAIRDNLGCWRVDELSVFRT
jgi:hypothetical protein